MQDGQLHIGEVVRQRGLHETEITGDTSNCGWLPPTTDIQRVGGAVIACNTVEVHMLKGRSGISCDPWRELGERS